MALAALCAASAAGQPCLEQRIVPSSPFSFGGFGQTVAISGDSVIVGRPTLAHIGSAFLFDFSPQLGWMQVQEVVAPDGVPGDLWCRHGIAIESDVAVMGSRGHEHEGHSGTGAVWLLRRIGMEWTFEQELLSPTGANNFGRRMSIDGNVMVVTMDGGAQLFQFERASWIPKQTLNEPVDIGYGSTASLDGNVLVMGAAADDSMCDDRRLGEGGNSGFVFVYRFNGVEWVEQQVLAPSDFGCRRHFGRSVALSGETIIATAQNPVATYVFEYDRESGQWIETAIFPGVGPETGTRPLVSAVEGDWAVIGDDSDDEAHVFHRQPDGSWELADLLHPPGALWFGRAVAIDQGRAIIGAMGEEGGHGAAYIYRLDAPAADLNCDGVVNGIDLGILLANWTL